MSPAVWWTSDLSVSGDVSRCPQLVAVWWSAAVGEIQPWTPSGRDQDRANVLVYRLTAAGQQAAGAAPGETPTG